MEVERAASFFVHVAKTELFGLDQVRRSRVVISTIPFLAVKVVGNDGGREDGGRGLVDGKGGGEADAVLCR